MQKIVVLPLTHEIMEYFPVDVDFKNNIPFLPDDIIAAGSWNYADATKYQLRGKIVLPVIVFFSGTKILLCKYGTKYRIWFGDPIVQSDILLYRDSHALVEKIIKKEQIRQKILYHFTGYCTDKRPKSQPFFLIVYTADFKKKRLLKQELLVEIKDIVKYYFKLDPLSKKIFDVFYESV